MAINASVQAVIDSVVAAVASNQTIIGMIFVQAGQVTGSQNDDAEVIAALSPIVQSLNDQGNQLSSISATLAAVIPTP